MKQGKKYTRAQKSVSLMALEFLYYQGPMTYVAMAELMREQPNCHNYKAKSIHTKLLDMEAKNLVTRDDKGIWYLKPGVTPNTLFTGELEMTTERLLGQDQEEEAGISEEEGEESGEPAAAAAEKPTRRPNIQPGAGTKPLTKPAGIPLDQRDMFIKHMSDIGVGPKEAIPTIADLFFAGDIDDLGWLGTVLKRHAAGYVSPHQRNLILGFWAKTRGLPYSEDDQDWTIPDKSGKGAARGKAEAKEERPEHPMDLGIGWKVGKDKAGDWCALPGGPLGYVEALDRAERRATIAAYGLPSGDEEGEAASEGEPAAPKGKGKGGGQSFVETMMLKIVEHMFDGGGGKDRGPDPRIEALQAELAAMKDDRMEERFERMEGLIAQAASRDPWDDYNRFQQQAQRFGYGPSIVTDNSPAVQLIKDQSEKIDRNFSRVLGIIERTALRSDEFAPEQTRSPEQRERKAGELLNVAQGREKSRQLRRDVFET